MTSFWKEPRGTLVLEREELAARAVALERKVKKRVRELDLRCRWPEPHKCRCGLEAAHLLDASLGGPMTIQNLMLVCGWIHRRGPASIHGKQLRIEADTAQGAQGRCSFYRQGDDGTYYMVAREVRPGQIERD